MIEPVAESGAKPVERRYGYAGGNAEPPNVLVVPREQPVGTEGRRDARLAVNAAIAYVVYRVVRRRDVFHVEQLQQPAHGQRGQRFIRAFVNVFGGLAIERRVDAEYLFQLEMRPIIKRTADELRQDLGVLDKLFAIARVARYVLFVHAEHAHSAPFVMIARQPQLAYAGKPRVGGDSLSVEVTVYIDHGQRLYAVVKPFRGFGVQQHVLSEKLFHPCSYIAPWQKNRYFVKPGYRRVKRRCTR